MHVYGLSPLEDRVHAWPADGHGAYAQEEMGLVWSNYWLWKSWAQGLYARHPERKPSFRTQRDMEAQKMQKGAATHSVALPSPKAP